MGETLLVFNNKVKKEVLLFKSLYYYLLSLDIIDDRSNLLFIGFSYHGSLNLI